MMEHAVTGQPSALATTPPPAQPEPSHVPPPRTIVGQKWSDARQYLIQTLPRWVLNHSSNVVGSMQLVAELFMFKSSNNDLITKGNEGKPLHYLIDPPRNIIRGSFQRSKLSHPWTDIFKPAKLWRELKDLDGAAVRDRVNNTAKLTNQWSARSQFLGMTSMAISTFLPEYSETPEETMAAVDMAHDHPLQYAGMRLKQAVNPADIIHNKRPLVGLGMTGAGFLSILSGFRQVEGLFEATHGGTNLHAPQVYRKNPWQMVGGLITMAAGSQLLLGVNNEQGWRSFGTTQLLRFATLPGSIGSRFVKNPLTGQREAGATSYFTAQSILAVKNTIASLIGGVQVAEDGTVIDHAKMRKEAQAMEREQRELEKAHGMPVKESPLHRITHPMSHAKAMPQLQADLQV